MKPIHLLSLALITSSPVAADTLREAAEDDFLIGGAIATKDLANPELKQLVAEQFDCLTPEYEMMPGLLVRKGWEFDFSRADRVVEFAEAHDLPVYGHMLLWHQVSADWLFLDESGEPRPREEALANLERYITEVMSHYDGRIKAWNVVNEAVSDADGEYLRDTPALRAIGEDYVLKAFEFAHAADPDVALYYNDYNIEQPEKREKALRLVRSLKEADARLDAVGIQGHWLIEHPSTDVIAEGIEAFAAEGLDVMITELDVDPLPREVSGADMETVEEGANPYPGGLPPAMQEKLAARYGEIMRTIVRHPAVTMVGFWGTHDGRSWLNDFPVEGRTNHPLLFDRELDRKPAYDAVIEALESTGD